MLRPHLARRAAVLTSIPVHDRPPRLVQASIAAMMPRSDSEMAAGCVKRRRQIGATKREAGTACTCFDGSVCRFKPTLAVRLCGKPPVRQTQQRLKRTEKTEEFSTTSA